MRKPVPRGLIIGGAIAIAGIGLWSAGAAIIPNLTDPEQNLARVAKQVAAGPKNSDDNKRMREEFDRAVRGYLSKQGALSTPEILKRLQKLLPAAAYEVHAVDLPRGLKIIEVDTVLQASDYLLMKGSSGNKVFPLSGIEVFDDARLINESAGPMLVAIGHSGGQPPHHPQVKVYALLPEDISDETDKLLPPVRGEGSAKFAKNGRDIILDLSLLSLGQLEQLFSTGPQTEDGTVHQGLEWKDAHYTSRYEYGSSPFTALYAVARCMRYPDLTASHRQFLGPKGEQLVRENKSQDAGNFRVKRLPASADRLAYLMTGSVGSFGVELAKTNGIWSVVATRNEPAKAPDLASATPKTNPPATEKLTKAEPTPIIQPEPAPARAPIVEKTLTTSNKTKAGTDSSALEEKKARERQKAEQDKRARQKIEDQREAAAERKESEAAKKKEVLAGRKEKEIETAKKKETERLERQQKEAARLKEKSEKKVAIKETAEPTQKTAGAPPAAEQNSSTESPTSPVSGQGQITAPGSVNLRSGPSTSSKPLTSVSKGAPIQIVGKQDGWYKVRYQGQDGYIYAGLVDYKKPDAYTTATLTKDRLVTDGHKKPLSKPKVGDRMVILGGLENNQYKVQMANGKTGFVDKDAVNVTVEEPQFVP